MKRLVIDARESGTTTGRYVDKLIANLAKLKADINFVVLTKPERVSYIRSIAPEFEVVASQYKEFGFGEQLGLSKQIKALKPDLVHFGMTQQPIRYRGKSITTVHDLTTIRFNNPAKNLVIFKSKQQVYRRVIKIVAKKSLAIITPTNYVKDDLVKFTKINPNKVIVTHEAAEIIKEQSEPVNSLTSKVFIMYVGRPQPHKNLNRLIQAFEILQATHPDLMLALAGKKDSLYQQIESEVHTNNIQNVLFTGFVTEGQLKWMYENTAAYLFPSLSEGFGLPGLEAMAHGAPVVSSSFTCLPEVYGKAAHYFDPTKPEDIAKKIADVIESKELRQELVKKGLAQASKYSWNRMAEQTLAVYKKYL